VAACRVQGPLLNRKAIIDRPDAAIVTNGHKVSHKILDVFPLSYQNNKNYPINAIKLSQPTVPLGYTEMGRKVTIPLDLPEKTMAMSNRRQPPPAR
jgi:hypothetical protein